MEEKLVEPDEAGLGTRAVKKRIELVRATSFETVRVSARQAERKAKALSRDNSEEGRSEEYLGKVKRSKREETDTKTTNDTVVSLQDHKKPKVDVIEEDFSTPKFERQESSSDLLDELVMDFGDEELDQEAEELPEDDDSSDELVEEERIAEDIAGEVAGELLEEKEAEDSEAEPEQDFEDAEPPVEESDDDYDEQTMVVPSKKISSRISLGKEKIWKYGKLWEFIRDLLKIPRYNPSVIRWEVEEEGEFRIVDSSMVARLWATVKGNKKMNYEKLSRAMRYYYKHKVFEIVPNKRLVYKFGSRAYNWRKQELERPGAPRVPCPAQGRRRTTWRCGECLRMFQSSKEHEVHTSTCRETLRLPEDQSKKDAEKLRSHLASRSQLQPRGSRSVTAGFPPESQQSRLKEALEKETKGRDCTDGSDKPLRQKLTELKSKLSPERTAAEFLGRIASEDEERVHPVPISHPSELTSMSTREHDALESLMCLGVQREPEKTEVPSNSPVPLPLMVTEINKSGTEPSINSSPEPAPASEASNQVARSYIVIPSLAALTGVLTAPVTPPPQTPNPKVHDKITFLKSSTEKSKTHTILQRRGERALPQIAPVISPPIAPMSDDEIEVVKVVKKPKEDLILQTLPGTFGGNGAGMEPTPKTVNVPSVLEKSSSAPLVVPSVLDQAIPPPPSFSDNTEPVKMTVKVNPKYANMIVNNSVAEHKKSDSAEHMEDSSYSNDSPRPEDKSEVKRREAAKAASPEAPSREIKINEKYLGLTPNPVQTSMGTLRMTSEKILDFVPNQSPVVNEETVQQQPSPPESRSSLIRINPKYKGLLTQNTENIAAKEDSTAQNQEKSSSPPTQPAPAPPMIKINPKYANLPGLPPLARQMMGINPETQNKSPMFSELERRLSTNLTEDEQQENVSIVHKNPNHQLLEGGTVTTQYTQEEQQEKDRLMREGRQELDMLKKKSAELLKVREILDKQESSQRKQHQTFVTQNRFKRVAESFMPSKQQTKRSRLSENLENLRRTAAENGIESQPATIIPRRYSDRIDRINGPVPALPTFMTKERSSPDSPEPLLGLWQFLRALLHNPAYNPKMVNWEILEEGMFRIHNLSDFYNLWRDLKKTEISYDLLTKTLKIYDDRKILHGVYNHRCVYKFGQNATDWRPKEKEIIFIGKKPVPSQASWPTSRFYRELDRPNLSTIKETVAQTLGVNQPKTQLSGPPPTTLFTLRPLDNTSTPMEEMKVMSDNSRIIRTNQYSTTLPPIAKPPTTSPTNNQAPLTLKSCTQAMAEIKIETLNDEVKEEKDDVVLDEDKEVVKEEAADLEVNCKLILPRNVEAPAVLTLPGGVKINLSRGLFKDLESNMALKNIVNDKNLKTTIIPRDRSQAFKTSRCKVLTRKKHQPRAFMENPLTVAQLMETMVPKKLNFILPKGSTGVNSPKLGGGLLGGAESSVENGLSSLPLTVLEKTNEERSVSLHLPEVAPAIQTSCATTPSTTTSHRLPGQVAHLPFTITSNHLPLTTSLLTIPSSSTSSSTSTASQPSNILLPATLANNSMDEREDEHISDESSNPEQVNKNVLRCRSYRNRKKNLLANQEEEVQLLETFNHTLRSKHDYLDSSIKRLQSYYLDMIR